MDAEKMLKSVLEAIFPRLMQNSFRCWLIHQLKANKILLFH